METTNEEQLLKIRSARACISAGFRLFMHNFRCIIRTTWLPALLTALLSALTTKMTIASLTLSTHMRETAGTEMDLTVSQMFIRYGLSLLSLIMIAVMMSYIFSMMVSHRNVNIIPRPARWWSLPQKKTLIRTMTSALLWVASFLIIGGITSTLITMGSSQQSMTLMIGGCVVMILLIALFIPIIYPLMHYVSTIDTQLPSLLKKGYVQSFKQWGFVFAVLFVLLLLSLVILSITMLPAIILIIANMQSETGTLIGDPAGMPSYMGWMSLLVFTLSSFIQVYVMASMHFPVYFMAGSIEQHEILRNEKAKDTLY